MTCGSDFRLKKLYLFLHIFLTFSRENSRLGTSPPMMKSVWSHLKHTKANYYIGELNKHNNNPKEMWNTVNKLINKNSKTTNVTELKINDETISKPQDIAEAFNTFFCEVGPNLAKNYQTVIFHRKVT